MLRQPFGLALSGLPGAQPPELLVRDMRHFTFSWKKSLGSRFSQLQNKSLDTVLPEEEKGKASDALPRSSMALLLLRPVRVQPGLQVIAWGRRLKSVRVRPGLQFGVMTRKSAGEEESEK